jgi:hypothetical protein
MAVDEDETTSQQQMFPGKRVLHGDGPIKAQHPSSYMNTINNEELEEHKSPFGARGKKPPLTTSSSKPSTLQ